MGVPDQIQEILERGVANGDVIGANAAVVGPDGVTASGAAGLRSSQNGAAMATDTVCWIASMTKAVTGLAAMQQVERGNLGLDSPAREVLPILGELPVLAGFGADGQPLTRPPARGITLRHLLTHTAGFGYDIWSDDLARYAELTGNPGVISCMKAALRMPLVFDPGDRWFYGTNIDYAGLMVEAVTGQSLGAYMAEHIFAPLAMTSTAFRITDDMRSRLSDMHARLEDGSLVPIEFEIPQEPEFEMGGGGLYSTILDYARFLQLFLNRGRAGSTQVIKPETVAEMTRNNMGDIRVEMLKTANPGYSHDAEFFPGVPKSWGLTFQINEEPAPTGRPAGGLMWAGLANSFYWIDLQNDVAGVYASQIVPFADPRTYQLFLDIESTVYRELNG
ncbi:MAG: beta-lactamase family protein [Acidimicrobiia bacterium]|nr:beta-lactamase family protein [Acidimicrobiia bacterium]